MMEIKEVKRTMKSMSLQELENRKKLDFMIPMDIRGRYQIMAKLKDLIVDVDEVIVKPVTRIPTVIRNIVPFFSTDGFWEGNFIAFGTNLYNNDILLWDDILVDEMQHYASMVETHFIKERLDSSRPVTLIVATRHNGKVALEFFCYLP